MSDILNHVHITHESVSMEEFTPMHAPREETPAYRKAHNFLIHEKKAPCYICGVNIDTISDPTVNILGAAQLESHHYPVERSLMNCCDPIKVHKDFPQVYDRETLESFVDSPVNLLVLCDLCHRSPNRGIHHLLTQDWIIQKYTYDGYQVAGNAQNAVTIMAKDEAIEQSHGMEGINVS